MSAVKRTEEPTDQDLATAEGVENKFAGKPLGRPKKETDCGEVNLYLWGRSMTNYQNIDPRQQNSVAILS